MEIKKRDFLAASMGLGLAASSALAQQGPATAAGGAGGRGGAGRDGAAAGRGGGRGGLNGGPVNSGVQPSSVDFNYKPRRLNKVIELWEDGQPMYYADAIIGRAGVDPYGLGVQFARTYADAVNVSMEHDSTLDFTALRQFCQGVVDGGPTRSGHRTPMLFTTTPIIGLDEAYSRANSWVLGAVLDCGFMGTHLCHARDPKAVQVAAQMSCRYPFDYPGVPKLPMEGLRGSSASFAAGIWGVTSNKYCHIADIWPLNPRGEMIFGAKIEDTHALANAEQILAIPGISMAEWGPGDMNYWLNGLSTIPEEGTTGGGENGTAGLPNMVAARAKVLSICKKNNVKFLNSAGSDVIQQIKDGVMVIAGGEAAAIIGREYTKRKMPV